MSSVRAPRAISNERVTTNCRIEVMFSWKPVQFFLTHCGAKPGAWRSLNNVLFKFAFALEEGHVSYGLLGC